ncbi:DegV family protein [Deinococcus sp. QL22]|uniref:DegV family protein n=1 Tax=Deinococcus sp. QL22 TaxID=2939437 RepID=UPI00201737E2|nr:DegV family protein [Deinococcus sp. QL22]UQN06064.1 DegV family protein [Deinococcus sp. QL22]
MLAVLTDSTCDLHPDTARQLGIHTVSLSVNLGARSLLDWQEVDPDAVYDHLRAGGSVSTEPVTTDAFEAAYRTLLQTHEQIISIHISGQLSETVKHAREAAERLGAAQRIHIVDSGLASAPLAEAVIAARETVQAGGTAEAARQAVETVGRDLHAEFTVPSLEYLRRGGRIGRAQEFFGNVLGMRPVLAFTNGQLKAIRRVRATGATQELLEALKVRYGTTPLSVTIAHAGRDPVRIAELRAAMIASGLNVAKGRVQLMGPVVGAHVGPGTYGFMARSVEA